MTDREHEIKYRVQRLWLDKWWIHVCEYRTEEDARTHVAGKEDHRIQLVETIRTVI